MVAVAFVLALALGSAGLVGGGRALGASSTLTIIGGDVSVRHGTGGAFAAALDGEVLNAGDAVRTAADARAVLTYFEGSTVTIEPSSELVIDAASAQGNDTIVQMTQAVGRTWHVVTKVVTGGSKYEVKTPAVTASVRGTAFTVETDGATTTIATAEGTVQAVVPDPQDPAKTIDVPVPAGQQQTQGRGQPPAPAGATPEPPRTVTVTISDEHTLVVDSLGRANGIDADGKIKLQTPGAKLERVNGKLVITLPDLPDGRLRARSRTQGGGEVQLVTTVRERGKSPVTSTVTIHAEPSGDARANVDIQKGANGSTKVEQTQAPSPSPNTNATPVASATAAEGGPSSSGGEDQSGSGSGGATPGVGNHNAASPTASSGTGEKDQGHGAGKPAAPSASGFIPSYILPAPLTSTPTPTPTPKPTHDNHGAPSKSPRP